MEEEMTIPKDANDITIQIDDDEDTDALISVENATETAQETDPEAVDLENKMAIIYNVLKSCIKEKNENVYYYMDHAVRRLANVTNLPEEICSKIINKKEEIKKTDEIEDSLLETPDLDSMIRRCLIKCYVKNKNIPKRESLMYIITKYCYYDYQINQQLKKSGYVWRRLPNTKRAIIMEHPKRVIQRQQYLEKIMNYRKEKRRIVYIETKLFTKADKHISYFQKCLPESANFVIVFIAVVNNDEGYLNGHVFVSKSIFKCQKIIEEYIIKNIVPKLHEPSIIILEDKPYFKKTLSVPTIESEKSDMIKWLKINGVPHEESLHRCELFDLIQNCKTKHDLHELDADLHAYGHEILRRPPRTEYLNYYRPLWSNHTLTEDLTIFIGKKDLKYWQLLDTYIIRTEKSVLHEDLEMDHVIDKILTMAHNVDVKEWVDAECEAEKDSLAEEEYIIQVQNTFLPMELQIREQQLLSEINIFKRVPK